jgi:hypothetical protein
MGSAAGSFGAAASAVVELAGERLRNFTTMAATVPAKAKISAT